MRIATYTTIVLGLVGALVLSGCSGDGMAPPATDDIGTVSLALTRSLSSVVPEEADVAWIRVWHAGAGTNLVRDVPIPDPGATTTVDFSVPARDGYSILIFATANGRAVAGGMSTGINVQPSGETEAHVDVVPWKVELLSPLSPAISGEPVTYRMVVTEGPWGPDVFDLMYVKFGLNPELVGSETILSNADRRGDTIYVTQPAPTVTNDTTLYFGFELRAQAGLYYAWGNRTFTADIPSLLLGDTAFSQPLTVPAGRIRITF